MSNITVFTSCLLFAQLFLLACTYENDEYHKESVGFSSLYPTDTLSFERDSTTYSFLHFHKLAGDSDAQFILGNSEGNSLVYYDQDGRIVKKNKIAKGQPDGIFSSIKGIYPHKHDSVFIFSGGYVYLVNQEGDIYSSWFALRMDKTVDYGLSSSLPAILFDSVLIYSTLYYGMTREIGVDWNLNLKQNKSSDFPVLSGYYPDEMKDGVYVGYPHLENFRDVIPERNSILYGLPGDRYLREVNRNGEEKKYLAIPNNYQNGGAPFKDEADAVENGLNHAKQKTFDKHIFSFVRYDSTKRLIYRAVYYPLSSAKIETMNRRDYRSEMEFNILVFDADSFRKIGESQRYKGRDFNLTNQFVLNGGLYVQLKDSREDVVSFVRFSLNTE